ncbi:MarR family winged helix-turn-helix transcriptional regulator [Citricoccus sp. GCM10030269]|uniref:MarR family winged helix-turn-helix transcriptional regulator n=1 Tax=Citricoccus sp. GCM10030269 TaxID=3273388 RepID=UPI00361AA21A
MARASKESTELPALVQALRRYAEAADRTTEAAGHHHGVHRTDLRALTILMQRQAAGLETTPTDLGRLLNLTSASTTALVDRLVANGHARRSPSTTDRRRVNISHTDSATNDGRAIFRPLAQRLTDRLAEFSPEQMQTAVDVLQAATETLDSIDASDSSVSRDSPDSPATT